jgi:hypothetical protein
MNDFDSYINDYLKSYLFENITSGDHGEKYKLGIFIGKFKPPHVGHYNTLMGVLGDGSNVFSVRYPQVIPDCVCDQALVIISDKSKIEDPNKDGVGMEFTGELSKDVWTLYLENTPAADKVDLRVAHPVLGAIETIEQIRSAGNYNGIPVNDLNIRLFVGEEEGDDGEIDIANTEKEMKRYSYIINNQDALLGKDDSVDVCVMARSTSATVVREQILRIAIDGEDIETLQENIPSHVDVMDFWNIARRSVVR